jgi:hypothetical protein
VGEHLTRPFHDARRTDGYTAEVWPLCIVQGPFSVALCRTLLVRFATFTSLCWGARTPTVRAPRCARAGVVAECPARSPSPVDSMASPVP